MSFFPTHAIGVFNLWIFVTVYGIANIILMRFLPNKARKRILTFPRLAKDTRGNFLMLSSFVYGKAIIVYSIFAPIGDETFYLVIGFGIYLLGVVLSMIAVITFSKEDLNKPVTKGIYKFSRHPMQTMNYVMWAGISLMSQTCIFMILTCVYIIISIPSLKKQEEFCLEYYGEEYAHYMKRTPRLLFFVREDRKSKSCYVNFNNNEQSGFQEK